MAFKGSSRPPTPPGKWAQQDGPCLLSCPPGLRITDAWWFPWRHTKLMPHCILSSPRTRSLGQVSLPSPRRLWVIRELSLQMTGSLRSLNISCGQMIGDPWACLAWNPRSRGHVELCGVFEVNGRLHFSWILETQWNLCVCALVGQSCPTLCNPMNCSPPGSSVHGISRQEYWGG